MKAHRPHGLGIVFIIALALGIPWRSGYAGQGAYAQNDLIAQAQPGSPAGPSVPAVRRLTQTTTTSTGQVLEFPAAGGQVTALRLEIAQGGRTGQVTFLVPTMLYVLEGTVEIEIQGGTPQALVAGQALAAPVNTPIAALNRGAAAAKVLEVIYGDARKPNPSPLEAPNTAGLRTTLVLQTTKTWTGEDIVFPPRANQFIALLVETAPGTANPRHVHPHTQFAYVLEGGATVEPDEAAAQTFGPGQAFVETLKPHVGANRGSVKGSLFTIFVGEAGTPMTVPMPRP